MDRRELDFIIEKMQAELGLERVGLHCYENLVTALIGERMHVVADDGRGVVKQDAQVKTTLRLMANSFVVLSKGDVKSELVISEAIQRIGLSDCTH